MQNARIFFEKTGDAKYISHLDLMRCFSRALTRAEVPLWYTEGFNPRPYMNFAMPLSLGMEGLSEILDIRIENDDMKLSEVKERLMKVMPVDIKIIDVKEPVLKAQLVAFSRYKIEIKQEAMSAEAFNNVVLEKLLDENLTISKMGKQGKRKVVKEIALTGHVTDVKVWSDSDKITTILVTLPSNPTFGINPSILITRVLELVSVDPIYVHITRKYMLDENLDKFY
ncbi:MAG: TIGR03936 family radical SAM-associated protein [Oscillospiraceae bacterium]|nr:TIGR03936 family radical SAM-associated protein [Candidatus Limimonas coprohippi]